MKVFVFFKFTLFYCEPEIGEPQVSELKIGEPILGEPILGEPSSHTFLFVVHLIPMVHLKSVNQWTMVHMLPMRLFFSKNNFKNLSKF